MGDVMSNFKKEIFYYAKSETLRTFKSDNALFYFLNCFKHSFCFKAKNYKLMK